jgi:hypothetical protein
LGVGFTAANALWVFEGLLFVCLVLLVRDRRRLEQLEEELADGTVARSSGAPRRLDPTLSAQWREMARQLRAEGKSDAEIELVRRQVFST